MKYCSMNQTFLKHNMAARCCACGEKESKSVKLTNTDKHGWELDLCPTCLPHEEEIVQGMAHHALTGD